MEGKNDDEKLSQVTEVIAERDRLEKELKEKNCDIAGEAIDFSSDYRFFSLFKFVHSSRFALTFSP